MANRTKTISSHAGRTDDRAEAERLLKLVLDAHQPLRLVGSQGESADVGASVVANLRTLLSLMAEGRPVTILPTETQLTTQAAAGLLNISRQYLVRLLDSGKLPSTKIGTHRRVLLDDLLAYKQRRDADRHTALDALTDLSVACGGYPDLPS